MEGALKADTGPGGNKATRALYDLVLTRTTQESPCCSTARSTVCSIGVEYAARKNTQGSFGRTIPFT